MFQAADLATGVNGLVARVLVLLRGELQRHRVEVR